MVYVGINDDFGESMGMKMRKEQAEGRANVRRLVGKGLTLLVGGSLAVVAGLGLVKSFERTPLESKDAVYGGYHCHNGDGNTYLVFRNGTNETSVLYDENIEFDKSENSFGKHFDVTGYQNSWGSYATNISPTVKDTSVEKR